MKRMGIVLALIAAIGGWNGAQAQSTNRPQLEVASATIDTAGAGLTIRGANFVWSGDAAPTLSLGGNPLAITSVTATEIQATLPPSLAPGTYVLRVSRGAAPLQNGSIAWTVAPRDGLTDGELTSIGLEWLPLCGEVELFNAPVTVTRPSKILVHLAARFRPNEASTARAALIRLKNEANEIVAVTVSTPFIDTDLGYRFATAGGLLRSATALGAAIVQPGTYTLVMRTVITSTTADGCNWASRNPMLEFSSLTHVLLPVQ